MDRHFVCMTHFNFVMPERTRSVVRRLVLTISPFVYRGGHRVVRLFDAESIGTMSHFPGLISNSHPFLHAVTRVP